MSSSEASVVIVPYDPAWPGRFEEEAKALRRALAAWLAGPIEHIGSTAIPGLAGKPVIDIMAGVETLDASRPAIAALADLGYSMRLTAKTPNIGSATLLQRFAPITFTSFRLRVVSGTKRSPFATTCVPMRRSPRSMRS